MRTARSRTSTEYFGDFLFVSSMDSILSKVRVSGKPGAVHWRSDWVLDIDIKGFFDNIDHELLLKAIRRHTDCVWAVLYIERWLKAPAMLDDGELVARDRG